MQGSIQLALERSPDYFRAAEVQNNLVEIVLCCDRQANGNVAGIASLGRRQVFLSGEPVWVRYLSDLRIVSEYRGMRLARLFAEYIREAEIQTPARLMQSIVFSDNIDILRFEKSSDRPIPGMDFLWCHKLGNYRTSAVKLASSGRRHQPSCEIRRATETDVPEMQKFFDAEASRKDFYPAYHFDQLHNAYFDGLKIGDFFLARQSDELVGITGVWDQTHMKQTRIAGYSGIIRWFRPLLNIASQAITGFALPPPGTQIRSFYLHTIVTRNNEPEIFQDLVEHIHDAYLNGSYSFFVCGLFEDDALIRVLDSFKARRDVLGAHYQVDIEKIVNPHCPTGSMYIEACRI